MLLEQGNCSSTEDPTVLRGKMSREQGNISLALAEGWQMDNDPSDPMIQVGSK